MFSPPTSTEGNVLGAVGALAAGAAAGAAIGSAASPVTPAGNKMVGAIEGGTIGVLATSLAGLLVGEWKPKYKKLGEMTGLVGLGAVVAMAAIGATKKAAAGTTPTQIPPPQMRTVQPTSGATQGGGRSFSVTTADGGSAVPMRVGDQLTISLPIGQGPAGQGADWFTFNSAGQPVNAGYQGLTFNGRSTQPVAGGQNVQYTYTATQSLGANVVQMVFQLLATDSSGTPLNPQPAGNNSATFTLWVGVQ
jgi:hypothetical protein